MDAIEARFGAFTNKNTWWHHEQAGTIAEFDRRYEDAVEKLRANLGKTHPIVIDGKEEKLDMTFTMRSPADRSLIVGHYASASKDDTKRAVQAARAGFTAWSQTPWQERAAILDKAAELFDEHFYDLCAAMTFETGKSRFEASIDVDEGADFLRFYALTMREMNGFNMTMGKPFPNETCHSLRKPWGTFAVLCPFNFPVAITAGMTAGALVTGNTVVLKPSQKGCLSGWMVFDIFRRAGVPSSALHYVTGTDKDVSATLLAEPTIDGIVFTGSRKVGMMAYKNIIDQGRPKPFIAEMGGKNPIVISNKADVDKAVQGVFRSAFGFSGQKCSACSRVYVHKDIAKEFKNRLVKLASAARVGLPWQKETFMGPVIDVSKVALLQDVMQAVRSDDGTILHGGAPTDEDADGEPLKGNYLQPTIVADLPKDHRVFREEFFMPFVAIHEVDSLDAGIHEANAVEYGLTAGVFSEDHREVQYFFDHIQAGVTYANRTAGGCTAAVVNGQSFVGWKLSGTTGTGAGGRYYLLQFTRERSQTVAV